MAKFLTTSGNSFHIEKLILEAEKFIIIVTPYLKLNQIITERLKDADNQNIHIEIIHGKNELLESQKNILKELKNLEIYYCQNLHSKCYFNEKSMIISSMNLYEFSEKNNREMGILIEKGDDLVTFTEAEKEVTSIRNASKIEKEKVREIQLEKPLL